MLSTAKRFSSITKIVDALLIAQYYVKVPVKEFHAEVADADCSGVINIVDSLVIVQFYMWKITQLECGTAPPP